MRDLNQLAKELGGTVGKTDWVYETEAPRARKGRSTKQRTKDRKQARALKQAMLDGGN